MIAILKLERNFDNWSTAVTTLAILGSINSMTVLLAGQTTWFIFFFFCLLFIGLNRNKALLTGASFALSTIKPQYSFLFFAGLIGHRRWKELLCFAGITALMLVFAGYVLGWSNVISYPQILSQKSAGDEFWYPQKQCNLRAIFCYLMPYETAYKVGFACVFLAIPFVWKLWTGIKNNSDRLRWTFAITVLLALTFGPHVNPYDCVLVGLAAILTLPTVSPIEAWSLESQPLKWWTFMMLCYPSLGWVLGSNNYVFIPLNIGLTICGFLYLNSMEMQKEKPEAPAHEEPAKE